MLRLSIVAMALYCLVTEVKNSFEVTMFSELPASLLDGTEVLAHASSERRFSAPLRLIDDGSTVKWFYPHCRRPMQCAGFVGGTDPLRSTFLSSSAGASGGERLGSIRGRAEPT